MKNIEGKAFRYGDNVDTDVIIPARYLNTVDPQILAEHCMEDIDRDFSKSISPGDLIVAGRNFGCGSSREHAPLAIKAAGVSCVIAESFARIFYRNAVNIGLAVMECPDAAGRIKQGDKIRVIPSSGQIENLSTGEAFEAAAFPPFIEKIIRRGGLIASLAAEQSEIGRSGEKS